MGNNAVNAPAAQQLGAANSLVTGSTGRGVRPGREVRPQDWRGDFGEMANPF